MVIWLNNGTLTMSARLGGAASQTDVSHPTALTVDNTWHHIAATFDNGVMTVYVCLLYTSPSPRDQRGSRMPSSA